MNHQGETVWIVGKGPSLLNLTADMVGPGPVVTLNDAVLNVRRLGLPNQLYVFSKDGCVDHTPSAAATAGPGHVCQKWVHTPQPPEIALFSKAESPHCMEWYSPRLVIDLEVDLGIPWNTPSSPAATRLFIGWGVSEIVYIAHDAHTHGDLRRVVDTVLEDWPDSGYVGSGRTAQRFADEAGIPTRYITP